MILPAGKYIIAKDFVPAYFSENLKYFVVNNEKRLDCISLMVGPEFVGYLAPDLLKSFSPMESEMGTIWENETTRTIETEKDQEVSERFYEWLVNNKIYISGELNFVETPTLPADGAALDNSIEDVTQDLNFTAYSLEGEEIQCKSIIVIDSRLEFLSVDSEESFVAYDGLNWLVQPRIQIAEKQEISGILERWFMCNTEVILPEGLYKIRLTPSLPTVEEFRQPLEFVFPRFDLSAIGEIAGVEDFVFPEMVLSFIGIIASPPEIEGEEPGDSSDNPLGMDGLPMYLRIPTDSGAFAFWLTQSVREFAIIEDQPVTWLFKDWLLSNLEEEFEKNLINFTVEGDSFTAVQGTNWNLWMKSPYYDSRITASEMGYLKTGNFLLSYNNNNIHINETIVSGREYKIEPQIRMVLNTPPDAHFNKFFMPYVGGVHIGHPGEVHTVEFTCEDTFHMKPFSQEIGDYIECSMNDNSLTIKVKDLPENFYDIPEQIIPLDTVQSFHCKMIEQVHQQGEDGAKLVEMVPQYKIVVDGVYCLSSGGSSTIETVVDNYQNKEIHAVSMSVVAMLLMFYLGSAILPSGTTTFASSGTSIEDLGDILSLLGGKGSIVPKTMISLFATSFGDDLPLPEKFYFLGSWIEDAINQDVKIEDTLGQSMMIFDNSFEEMKKCFLELTSIAMDGTIEEAQQHIEEYAQSNGLTIDDAFTQLIEEEFSAPIDQLTVFKTQFVDYEMLETFQTWLDKGLKFYSSKSIFELMLPSLGNIMGEDEEMLEMITMFISQLRSSLLYSGGDINDIIYDRLVQGKPENEQRIFGLFNKGDRVRNKVVLSDFNDFSFYTRETGTGTTDSPYDSVDALDKSIMRFLSFSAPKDRFTPGTVKTEIVWKCLSGDTLITMGDGSKKRIDQLKNGDEVLTPTGAEKIIISDSHLNKTRNEFTDYYFSDGSHLRIIRDHRVYNPKKKRYIHISALNIGDIIMKQDGSEVALVKKVTTIGEKINHYTLFTENKNAYYANEILCGNTFSNIKPSFLRKSLLNILKLLQQKE